MRAEFLPFSPPLLGEQEILEVVDTLRSDWITTGPKTASFESAFAQYLGSEGALAVNSCTAALHLALAVLGVGEGDEVITTPLTFASTVNVIEHLRARPVLVDVRPDTLQLDPERLEAAINDSTRVILPVHYTGHPSDLDCIGSIAEEYGLTVVEDAAHALPAKYKGRFIGSGSGLVAFSFYATKNLTTAEGGMLTGDLKLLEKARILSLHGMSKDAWKRYDRAGSWYYEVVAPGFKYNMTDIQASLGLVQLKRLESFQRRRREIARAYNDVFNQVAELEVPVELSEVEHAWHLYVLRLRPEMLKIGRDQFTEELKVRNIGTSVHFIPIHLHPYYRDKYDYGPNDFPIAYSNYRRMLSLPLNPRLSDQDVADVIEAVLDVVRAFRR